MVLYCRVSAKPIFEQLAMTGAAGQRETKLSMEHRGDQGKEGCRSATLAVSK